VIQLKILSGKMAGTEVVARRLPFRVGRSAAADFRIEDAGVWDEHLTFSLSDGRLGAAVEAGALATVNGETLAGAPLRNGDVIQIGAAQIAIGLAPTRQRSFRGREALVWIGLALLSLSQVGLIYWLLN